MVKELSDGVTETQILQKLWKKYSLEKIIYDKTRSLFIFFVYIFIHISANMSPFGLKFSQMILHTETSKLMYNWSFLFCTSQHSYPVPLKLRIYRLAIVILI